MSKLVLNRGQIISTGLALAGRPDLTAESRIWLNLFLDEFYSNQDVDWLVKSVSGQAVYDGVPFPSDYRAMKSLVISDSGSELEVEVINDADEYDRLRIGYTNTSGFPNIVWADHDNQAFRFLPAPKSGLTMDIKYYYWPELPDSDDASSDLDEVKWGLNTKILVDFVKAMAMEYNDDVRQDNAHQMVMNKIAQAKFNDRDARAGSTKTKMGRSFRRNRRRGVYSGNR